MEKVCAWNVASGASAGLISEKTLVQACDSAGLPERLKWVGTGGGGGGKQCTKRYTLMSKRRTAKTPLRDT